MRLFTRGKSRATRRAEAKALKSKAKLEAKLAAKNEVKRIAVADRAEARALRAQVKAQRDSDRAAIKVAEAQLRAAREGSVLSPARVRRTLTVARLLAPVLVPLAYRAFTAIRGLLDERRADRLGVPLSQLGQYSGDSGELSARIAGAEQSLRTLTDRHSGDAETANFAAAVTARLNDLVAAVAAAEHMPPSRRRSARSAISGQLDGIDADLMARLGVL